jgi:hypothetical protein
MKPTRELESLIQAYIDGVIDGDGSARLNSLLEADAEARRAFVERLNLDTMIAATAAGWIPQAASAPRQLSTRPNLGWVLAVAAGLAIVASFLPWWRREPLSFARVEKSLGVDSLPVGSTIHGKEYRIDIGTVEIVSTLGARIVIEAPAEFRFEHAQLLHLQAGRLAAEVPPAAKGFTVLTPSGEVVDLGTSFGIDVPKNASAEVHVFEGEVVATATGAKTERNLLAGDALTMEDGVGTSRSLRTAAFIKVDEMNELADQRARSEAALDPLRADPALIALLDFESEAVSYAGVFRTVQGRWPGSRAPEFVNAGDHLKLDVGGHRAWPQLTLAAWARLDQLGSPYQSLLHTDNWDQGRSGQVHWMINEATTMRLALFDNELAPGSDETQPYPDSRTPVLSDQGRWIHLVTVYDAAQGTVRFFINGRLDKEVRQSTAHPAQLGSAQIGNWNKEERKLSGRLDELIILGRAMNEEEVSALFHAGNPYRDL